MVALFLTTFMAPTKAVKNIKVKVPRHNAQRINAKLCVEVKNQAKTQGILVDTVQPSSKLSQAIVKLSLLSFDALTLMRLELGKRFGLELFANDG